jgi:hypothetical protein
MNMNYWLIKSEPDAWSWDQQVAKGAKGEAWTGVRNHTAKQNLMKMRKGDRAFFYHSGEGKEIVGIAEVIRESFPDPTACLRHGRGEAVGGRRGRARRDDLGLVNALGAGGAMAGSSVSAKQPHAK